MFSLFIVIKNYYAIISKKIQGGAYGNKKI